MVLRGFSFGWSLTMSPFGLPGLSVACYCIASIVMTVVNKVCDSSTAATPVTDAEILHSSLSQDTTFP